MNNPQCRWHDADTIVGAEHEINTDGALKLDRKADLVNSNHILKYYMNYDQDNTQIIVQRFEWRNEIRELTD
jgi:hypothetical protein